MKILLPFLLAIALFSCNQKKKTETAVITNELEVVNTRSLTKLWETDTLLKTCESVFYDEENDVIYVSNIGNAPPDAKDNDGFMSKISTDGKILELDWVSGLHAPKGMGKIGNKLYVTDIDEVVEIDILAGEIAQRYPIEGAKFLNDITIAKDETIYISDNRSNKIYSFKNGKATLWLEKEDFGGPNGLLSQGSKIMVAAFASGNFLNVNIDNQEIQELANGIIGGDGIAAVGDDYLVSSWHGEVYYVDKNGSTTKLLDTKEAKINAADIDYSQTKNLLLVPTFFGNKVVAYRLD